MKYSNASHPKIGRKGDPRMNRAVRIRLDNPKMSLVDALLAGGFTFPTDIKRQNKKEPLILDSDGVSLNQRRNQLSKRLWQAIKKRDANRHKIMHHDEEVLSENNKLSIPTKGKTVSNVGYVQQDRNDSKQMHLFACSHVSQPISLKDVTLNEPKRKTCREDGVADFVRLTELLFDVPTVVLSNEGLTLDQLMAQGTLMDQIHNYIHNISSSSQIGHPSTRVLHTEDNAGRS
mmetsp:Transcript_21453/g.31885  ORF Transcript_21453/g.31885 Transcript_21453/m.31885 type:complete len:232 (-) Transcript_21453:190-885(-)